MSAKYSGMKVQTAELIAFLVANKGRVIEASLIKGFFNFTHFMDFGGRVIYDMGIDSKEVSRRPHEFLERYQNEWRRIEQIV